MALRSDFFILGVEQEAFRLFLNFYFLERSVEGIVSKLSVRRVSCEAWVTPHFFHSFSFSNIEVIYSLKLWSELTVLIGLSLETGFHSTKSSSDSPIARPMSLNTAGV